MSEQQRTDAPQAAENPQHIVLFNPISNRGHLDGWAVLMAECLLLQGYRVSCLTKNTGVFSKLAAQYPLALAVIDDRQRRNHHPVYSAYLAYFDGLDRIHHWWGVISDRYVNRRKEAFPAEDAGCWERAVKWLARAVTPPVYSVFDFCRRRWRWSLRPLHPMDPLYFVKIANEMGEREGERPDFVFHTYLDMYLFSPADWEAFSRSRRYPVRYPWGGIRFVPMNEPDALCSVPSFRGACLLDETCCEMLQRALPDKVFTVIPDFTGTGLPDAEPPIVTR
ncbi:MAG: hypothetical protein LBR29_00180, partial [Methylobacteriaceae bacterium]|nr:hypothetical protein [Methylobacteriaceae bacterium]